MPTALQLRSTAAQLHGQRRQPCRQRHQQRCKAEAGSGGPSRDEVLARINRAKEYKQQTGSSNKPQAAQPVELPVQAAATPAQQQEEFTGSGNVEQAFSNAAQALASKEESQFLQAISQAQQRSSGSDTSSDTGSQGPRLSPPSTAPSSSAAAASAASSREALLERINAAKQYKQGGSAPVANSGSGSSSGTPRAPAVHPPPQPPPAATPPAAAAAARPEQQQPLQQPPQPQAWQQQSDQREAEEQRSFRTGGGGADTAANWLIFADSSGGGGGAANIDTNLSAEQFTIAKEEWKKRQEVEIITVDASWAQQVQREKRAQQAEDAAVGTTDDGAAAGGEADNGGEDVHQPKVATWGVFPRPRDISAAYGGGRNLKPGQALESEEAAAERQARVSAALKEYRKTLGLDIDPAVERRAQDLYNEGVALFEQGLITSALPKFTEASDLMALRSRLGGEARLQQAICLDSLGRNQEAFELYKKVENHPAPGVAKKAKRMLFGWKASETLKTERISYQPSSSQWKRYFDAINRNSLYAGTYVAPEEGGQEGGGAGEAAAAAAAVGVVLLPLAFVAYRILMH